MTEKPPRNHHYVPAGFMKAWADNDGRVGIFKKNQVGRVNFRRDFPAKVMYRRDLYADKTYDRIDIRSHRLEVKYLQQLDHSGAELQTKMLATGRVPEGADRRTWVRFLMSLMNRHPDDVEKLAVLHRRMWQDSEKDIIRRLRREFPDMDPILIGAKIHEDWSGQAEKARVDGLTRMMDFGIAGAVVDRGFWQVLNLDHAQHDLVLSDKPVYRSGTFNKRGDFLAMPISPKYLFWAEYAAEPSSKSDAKKLSNVVSLVNENTIGAAREFVVAANDGLRELVSSKLGTRPARSIADIMAEGYGL